MQAFIWMIADLAALAILIAAVGASAQRGFLDCVAGFITSVVAAVAAWLVSLPLANFLYTYIVRDAIRAAVTRQVEGQIEEGVITAGNWMLGLPGWFGRMLAPQSQAIAPAQDADNVNRAVEVLVDVAIAQPVTLLLRILLFLLLFLIIWRVGKRLAQLLDVFGRLPLIGSVNTLLGGILGVCWGAIILYLLALLSWAFIYLTGGGNAVLNTNTLGDGYLFSFFFRLAGSR